MNNSRINNKNDNPNINSLFCLIFSDIKMLIFGLSFLLFVLQLSGRNGFWKNSRMAHLNNLVKTNNGQTFNQLRPYI